MDTSNWTVGGRGSAMRIGEVLNVLHPSEKPNDREPELGPGQGLGEEDEE